MRAAARHRSDECNVALQRIHEQHNVYLLPANVRSVGKIYYPFVGMITWSRHVKLARD